MFRTARQFGTGAMWVIVMSSLMALSGCNQSPPLTPTPLVGNTPVVVTGGPTLAQSSNVALAIINAMPAQIGRFTLSHDPKLTYVGTVQGIVVGDRITYTTSSGAQLVFAVWIGQDANYPVDRYKIELQRLNTLPVNATVQAIPVEVGDEAFVAPASKGLDDGLAFNPAPWGIVRFRNILIDVYPTKTLTDQTSTTLDEAKQMLQIAVNAIPK